MSANCIRQLFTRWLQMHSIRLSRITPHPMVYMLGQDCRESNDGRHKLSRQPVVTSDNPVPR
jgi:hypothetical protein